MLAEGWVRCSLKVYVVNVKVKVSESVRGCAHHLSSEVQNH